MIFAQQCPLFLNVFYVDQRFWFPRLLHFELYNDAVERNNDSLETSTFIFNFIFRLFTSYLLGCLGASFLAVLNSRHSLYQNSNQRILYCPINFAD